jgi:6-phospho-3-hexuloisomerase
MDQGPVASSRPWLAIGREIAGVLERVDPLAFERLVDRFREPSRRWFFSGQGRSGLAAQMAAMRFMHMGRSAHFVGEPTAPSIRAGDGLALVSGSGETPVSIHFARLAKSEGAEIVLITRHPSSTLATLADVVLPTPIHASDQFGGSLFEQASLILLDAIVLEIAAPAPDAHQRMLHRHTNLQ